MKKRNFFNLLQRLGQTFMLPIALLPIAGLFLGIGATITGEAFVSQWGLQQLLGEGTILKGILSILTAVGEIIFANLALLFAIAVASGLSEKRKEVAALSAVVGYLVMYQTMTSTVLYFRDIEQLKAINGLVGTVLGFESTLNMGVFGGIIIGFIVSVLHNKYYNIKFNDAFSFFAGTHFVPIISSVAAIVTGFLLAFIWPFVGSGIAWLGEAIARAGALGSFFYGYVYRALIPFGLHHVFYLPFWQTAMGGTMEVAGQTVQGAQNIVFAQLQAGEVISPEAAKYFSFAFPMMLVGFPAAALAMYHTAYKDKKAEVKGLLLSSSITSFLTGITEPIEFSILFASPFLYYGVNAVLAGLSVIIVQALKIGVGFTFSAGLLDFVLYGILPGNARTHWMTLALYSLVWGLGYYFIFRWAIQKWDLKTPGREDEENIEAEYEEEKHASTSHISKEEERSKLILEGLGGLENIEQIGNCATRLRVSVKDGTSIEENLLRKSGAAGITVKGSAVQVIYGTQVGGIATDLDNYIEGLSSTSQVEVEQTGEAESDLEAAFENKEGLQTIFAPVSGELLPLEEVEDEVFASGVLGRGVAIKPSEGKFISPAKGKIVTVFPTGHAIGLETAGGVEILLHIGLDTVELGGKGFKTYVEVGDEVSVGDLLVEVDLDLIREAGYSTWTPMVVTNADSFAGMDSLQRELISSGDPLITIGKE